MPCVAINRPNISLDDLLRLSTGLSAIVAGVLWYGVYLAAANALELCSQTPVRLDHCPLCYPAAFATVAAVISAGLQLSRRQTS